MPGRGQYSTAISCIHDQTYIQTNTFIYIYVYTKTVFLPFSSPFLPCAPSLIPPFSRGTVFHRDRSHLAERGTLGSDLQLYYREPEAAAAKLCGMMKIYDDAIFPPMLFFQSSNARRPVIWREKKTRTWSELGFSFSFLCVSMFSGPAVRPSSSHSVFFLSLFWGDVLLRGTVSGFAPV